LRFARLASGCGPGAPPCLRNAIVVAFEVRRAGWRFPHPSGAARLKAALQRLNSCSPFVSGRRMAVRGATASIARFASGMAVAVAVAAIWYLGCLAV